MAKKYVYELSIPDIQKLFRLGKAEVERYEETFFEMFTAVGWVEKVNKKDRTFSFYLEADDAWELHKTVHELYDELISSYGYDSGKHFSALTDKPKQI